MHMLMGQPAAKPKARARATPRWTVMLAPSPPPGMISIVEAAGDLLTELNEEEEERTRTTRRNSTMQRWKPPWMWLWSSPYNGSAHVARGDTHYPVELPRHTEAKRGRVGVRPRKHTHSRSRAHAHHGVGYISRA
jgi:hypothetical protein